MSLLCSLERFYGKYFGQETVGNVVGLENVHFALIRQCRQCVVGKRLPSSQPIKFK